METPNPVLVHNQILGVKGASAELVRIHEYGFYEVNLKFGDREHRVLLPIDQTVIVSREPEIEVDPEVEIER